MLEPVSVGLKFAFLAILYLFLLWVSRSALKDLRRGAFGGAPRAHHDPVAADATGMHAASSVDVLAGDSDVRPPEDPEQSSPPAQASHGNTMIYSTAGRIRSEVDQVQGVRAPRPTRALLVAEGRRHVIPPGGALVGRSRECDVVLADANVSRRHAEILPGAADTWTIADLGSTNGVLLNGRRISGAAQLTPGDRIALGTAEIAFELE